MNVKYYNSSSLGILPNEPKFYSEFDINESFGMHSIENKYVSIENGNDNDNDFIDDNNSNENKYGNVTIILNRISDHSSVNMNLIDELTIICYKSTIFFIHCIKGSKDNFFKSNGDYITTISYESSSKILILVK